MGTSISNLSQKICLYLKVISHIKLLPQSSLCSKKEKKNKIMTDGAPIDSVLFDPRLDPENPKSRKIIYDITKNMNKLTLADKYSAAAKLKKRTSLEYHDKQIKNSRH